MAKGYCIKCLRKFPRKRCPSDKQCPHCLVPLRFASTKTVAQVVTRCARQRGLKAPTKKSDYQIYLTSALWRVIRRRVLKRDYSTCVMCREVANTVHHRSYDQDVLDGNRDEDLISLCRPCHKRIEFTMNRRNKRVKNSLARANEKLDTAIARLSARLQSADQSLPPLGVELQKSKAMSGCMRETQVDLATEQLDRLGCNATSFELAANPGTEEAVETHSY